MSLMPRNLVLHGIKALLVAGIGGLIIYGIESMVVAAKRHPYGARQAGRKTLVRTANL